MRMAHIVEMKTAVEVEMAKEIEGDDASDQAMAECTSAPTR
jgi:hypothetical protein